VRELQPAGLWRRLVAGLVDCAVGLLAWGLAGMWLMMVAWGSRSPLELRVFVGGCGQTPGKMALGIMVVRRDGERAGHGRAMVRCLGGMFSALTLGLSSIGVLFGRERRGFADWLAGTRVVRGPGAPG
jgi:uncharacterized RDD family membrane protein YckC